MRKKEKRERILRKRKGETEQGGQKKEYQSATEREKEGERKFRQKKERDSKMRKKGARESEKEKREKKRR